MIKVFYFSLFIPLMFLIACNKNSSGIKTGTYYGTVHQYSSYATITQSGPQSGSTDTVYEDVLTIEKAGPDSVRFIFQNNQSTFKLLKKNEHYCQACDPTRNLSDYQVVSNDVYYHFHIYGGFGSSYNSASLDFTGTLH